MKKTGIKKAKLWNSRSIRDLARAHLEASQALVEKAPEEARTLSVKPEFVWGTFEKSTGDSCLIVVSSDDPDGGSEIELLCQTLQLKNKAFHVLPRHFKPNPATYIGSGTLENLKERMQRVGAETLVLDLPLSAIQVRNMEDFLKVPVLDRQALILGIFKHHARSKLAKLQVELAQLKYLQPRLSGLWLGLSRQGGGLGARGLGETRLELDRRVIKDRIVTLADKLKDAQKSFKVQSSKRSHLPRVAIVGYTNAGKSSLMKALTKAPVLSKDELFSTLDTTVRPLNPPTDPKVLVSDTVGFVRNLPHDLVVSFKSTLQEALESRLLLHVVDASHAMWREHLETTFSVLHEIGAGDIPVLYVFNKMDLLGGISKIRFVQMKRFVQDMERRHFDALQKDQAPTAPRESSYIMISAKAALGIAELREHVMAACGCVEPSWAVDASVEKLGDDAHD